MTLGLTELALAALVGAQLVVIDPGHGGAKTGAISEGGTTEKAIALGVARQMKAALTKLGVQVVLTRDVDRHVSLADRVAVANARGASAFVSIHLNASPVVGRRGCETYILSAQASDDVSAAHVAMENDGESAGPGDDAFGGPEHPNSDVSAILGDLQRSAAHEASARLAAHLQKAMGQVEALGPSRGLRQAPFKVLRRAAVPSALVEIGYMSHAGQSAALSTRRAQRAAGQALAQGVIEFLREAGGRR